MLQTLKNAKGKMRISGNLLDRLPTLGGQQVYLEEHWTRDDRDGILLTIAKLGASLRIVSQNARSAHEAGKLGTVQNEIALALLMIEDALLPVFGADPLWPLHQATEVLNLAHKGKRHWLVTLRMDEPRLPQRAPYRVIMQTVAAAALDYFDSLQAELKMSQEAIAGAIAGAMEAGGFMVRLKNGMPPASRTVQDWRNQFAPARRPGRVKPNRFTVDTFHSLRKLLEDGRDSKPAHKYFAEALTDITIHCRYRSEVFHDGENTGRKT